MDSNHPLEAPAFWGWFDQFVASIKSIAFRTGLELAIWGKIAEGYRTAEAIAAQEGWDVIGVRRLLNVLVSIGLLSTDGNIYQLVPEAGWYLIPGKPTYMGGILLYLMDWEGDRPFPQIGRAARVKTKGRRLHLKEGHAHKRREQPMRSYHTSVAKWIIRLGSKSISEAKQP